MIRLQAFYPSTKDGYFDHDYYVKGPGDYRPQYRRLKVSTFCRRLAHRTA